MYMKSECFIFNYINTSNVLLSLLFIYAHTILTLTNVYKHSLVFVLLRVYSVYVVSDI